MTIHRRYTTCCVHGLLRILRKHSPHRIYITRRYERWPCFQVYKGDAISEVQQLANRDEAPLWEAHVYQWSRGDAEFEKQSRAGTTFDLVYKGRPIKGYREDFVWRSDPDDHP